MYHFSLPVLFVLSSFSFSYSQSGWFSQPLPLSGQVRDLKFFDANTGLIAMIQPTAILRTTNGGYNWYSALPNQLCFQFDLVDSNVVYAAAGTANAYGMFLRSTNRGATWDSLPVANSVTVNGISFVNKDTGWVGGTASALPFIWRTTNAGVTWTVQSDNTGFGKVFFLKNKVNGEYVGWSIQETVAMYKTTNSGVNWFQVTSIGNASTLYFIDENTGWASKGNSTKKTTNGGLNWSIYYMPSNFNIGNNYLTLFKVFNKDTIYGVGGNRDFGTSSRGIIWVSTNGGVNWGFQQPDTSIHRNTYSGIDFINKDTGWCNWIRTNDGGGPIIITSYIDSSKTVIPDEYLLIRNYPNPFNSSTTIEFSLPKESYTTIRISDLNGKTVFFAGYELLLKSGIHRFKIEGFGKLNLASGVYFCRMSARDYSGKINLSKSQKMLYVK